MNHRSGYNELSKTDSHRKAMIKNMVSSLIKHGRVTTTKAKAKAVQIKAERMITRAKIDSVHNRRIIARTLGGSPGNKAAAAKLFTEISPVYTERAGGYTRIVKIGARQGDAACMVILELLDKDGGSLLAKKAGKKAGSSAGKKGPGRGGKAGDKASGSAPVKAGDKAAGPAEGKAPDQAEASSEAPAPEPAGE
ncbi:MAG: 50S ribosomal protein L17 [Spirochaetales bacterium]|jgi:large subunit ribosomal protein L17|nr:50S ribosomal protein L17 [Spirochaetales bacterium]